MSNKNKDKEFVKTSIKQPRILWNKVRTEAIDEGINTDQMLTEILKEHYGAKEHGTQ